MHCAKFGLNWPSGSGGKVENEKSLQWHPWQTMDKMKELPYENTYTFLQPPHPCFEVVLKLWSPTFRSSIYISFIHPLKLAELVNSGDLYKRLLTRLLFWQFNFNCNVYLKLGNVEPYINAIGDPCHIQIGILVKPQEGSADLGNTCYLLGFIDIGKFTHF